MIQSEGAAESLVSAAPPDVRLCPSGVPGLELVNRWGENRRSRARLLLSAQPPAPGRNQTLPHKWGNRGPEREEAYQVHPGRRYPGAGVGGLLPSGSFFRLSERRVTVGL